MKRLLIAVGVILLIGVIAVWMGRVSKEETKPVQEPTSSATDSESVVEPISVGEKIGSASISSFKVDRDKDSDEINYLKVDFDGEIKIKARYEYVSSDNEAYGDEIMIYYEGDEDFPGNYISDTYNIDRPVRELILKFDGVGEKELFGKPGIEGEVQLTVQNYEFLYAQTDETDTAEFVSIESISNGLKKFDDIASEDIEWVKFQAPDENDPVSAWIEQYYSSDLKEMEGADAVLEYAYAKKDLNGDSNPEILVEIFNSSYIGGSYSSYFSVFPYSDQGLGQEINISLGNVVQGDGEKEEVGVVEDGSEGWKDIVYASTRIVWSWNGNSYEGQSGLLVPRND
jgi:hypothetical protein